MTWKTRTKQAVETFEADRARHGGGESVDKAAKAKTADLKLADIGRHKTNNNRGDS